MTVQHALLFQNYPRQGQFIAGRLVELRKNQSWLAKETKSSAAQLSNIMNGKSRPSLGYAVKIAEALNVTLDDFAASFS